jgi:hypothetical protein
VPSLVAPNRMGRARSLARLNGTVGEVMRKTRGPAVVGDSVVRATIRDQVNRRLPSSR